MMPTVRPTFDVLHLTWRLASQGYIQIHELHTLAYLACMLSVFDGWSTEEWGYRFAATPFGTPYATTIASAVDNLMAAGMIYSDDGCYRVSEIGKQRRVTTATHHDPSVRLPYLDASANTTLALALPVAIGAVLKEPQLRASVSLTRRRRLLDETGLALLEPHFTALRMLSSETEDPRGKASLFALAVLWLRYLQVDRS